MARRVSTTRMLLEKWYCSANNKKSGVSILRKKNKARGVTLPDFSLLQSYSNQNSKDTGIKTDT